MNTISLPKASVTLKGVDPVEAMFALQGVACAMDMIDGDDHEDAMPGLISAGRILSALLVTYQDCADPEEESEAA